jgi:hypothetical protein
LETELSAQQRQSANVLVRQLERFLIECGEKIAEDGGDNGRTNDVGRGKESRVGIEQLALAEESLTRNLEGLARMDKRHQGHSKATKLKDWQWICQGRDFDGWGPDNLEREYHGHECIIWGGLWFGDWDWIWRGGRIDCRDSSDLQWEHHSEQFIIGCGLWFGDWQWLWLWQRGALGTWEYCDFGRGHHVKRFIIRSEFWFRDGQWVWDFRWSFGGFHSHDLQRKHSSDQWGSSME